MTAHLSRGSKLYSEVFASSWHFTIEGKRLAVCILCHRGLLQYHPGLQVCELWHHLTNTEIQVMDAVVDYRWLRNLHEHFDPRVRHAWLELTYQESLHLKVSVAY
jgi:hypothetical protein